MKNTPYIGPERRQFVRLEHSVPLAYKICKKETITKLMQGYTGNVSSVGILCNIKQKVEKDDVLWLSFDRSTLHFCEELEKKSLIYQNGVIGKVARIDNRADGTFNVGVQFLIREEKYSSHIYPKIYFLNLQE